MLANREPLHERSIYVKEARSAECVAARGSVSPRCRFREVRNLGGCEVIDARSQRRVSDAADATRAAVVREGRGGARSGGESGADRERRTALPDPETAHVPAADDGIQPTWHISAYRFAAPDGQRIQAGHSEGVRDVEVGTRTHQRFVEAIERRGEAVALPACSARLIVVDRLTPSEVTRQP